MHILYVNTTTAHINLDLVLCVTILEINPLILCHTQRVKKKHHEN